MRRSLVVGIRIGVSALVVAAVTTGASAQSDRDDWPRPPEHAAETIPWLMTKIQSTETPEPRRHPGVVASLRIRSVDVAALRSHDNDTFRIPLPGLRSLVVVRDRQVRRPHGLSWFGHVEGDKASLVTLSLAGDRMHGKISSPIAGTYLFFGGLALPGWLYHYDPRQWMTETDLTGHIRSHFNVSPVVCDQTDPPSPIDVLVAYTPEVKNGELPPLDDADMEARIFGIIDEANADLTRSGVNTQLRLVHIEEVAYTASGDPEADQAKLCDTGDSTFAALRSDRETYSADIVVLIVESGNNLSGYADPVSSISHDNESRAYAVVVDWAAVADHGLEHEFGHLMGASHGCEESHTGAADYAHGHAYQDSAGDGWRTIMSRDLTVPRIGYWSNPSRTEPGTGKPLGETTSSCKTNNARILNDSALTVANYRCSVPTPNDVWMRDTWDDTGDQPDLATVGQAMWKSPYIWVRRAQDTHLENLHQHQDPTAGATNWVYAKAHNGSPSTATGTLDFYWAPASTANLWSADWQQFASVSTTFNAHSTRVVEAQFDAPAESGFYCLAVHWTSTTDSSPVLATKNMEPNVRESNNLIWKNVKVVDLIDILAVASYRFDVRSLLTGPDADVDPLLGQTFLAFRPSIGSLNKVAEIVVRFDATLLQAWNEADRWSEGCQFDGDEFLLTGLAGAKFRLRLDPGTEGRVYISFKRRPSAPRGRTYELDVEQSTPGSGVDGGLSFEIRT